MKKLSLILLLLVLGFFASGKVLASFSKSVTETYIEEGSGEVYQYVETTIDGQTVRKESTQPGKLELEMKKTGESEPIVTFSQEEISSLQPTEVSELEREMPDSFVAKIIEFFRKLFSSLTRLTGLDRLI